MISLSGRVALVTGASRGIGFAIAQRFAAEGASVVLCASRLGAHGELQGTLESAIDTINAAGGKAAAAVCDLTDEIALRSPDMAEPVEMMAEAALALCRGSFVGLNCYSRQLVHSLGLPVKSLDGQCVPGDAFLPADLDATA